jgi:murein lipoprotein
MNKVILGAILAGTLALAGCSSEHATLDQVQTDVKVVQQKVDVLEKDVVSLRQDVDQAKGEAARANQRLDNQVTTYRK